MSRMERGPADKLSHDDRRLLSNDLDALVKDSLLKGEPAWKFGAYGIDGKRMAKRAPIIQDLVENRHFLIILLRYMKHAKMRDADLLVALKPLFESYKINSSDMPDGTFITWILQSAHVQLTHLRNLKMYPERYEFRMKDTPPPVVKILKEMLAMISDTNAGAAKSNSIKVTTPKPCTVPMLMEHVPDIFKNKETCLIQHTPPPRSRSTSIIANVPSIFVVPSGEGAMTPKKQTSAFDIAMETPPLPSGRGEIKNTCDEEVITNDEEGIASMNVAYVEHALKGNVRTYVRVYSPKDGKKRQWASITAQQSPNHAKLIQTSPEQSTLVRYAPKMKPRSANEAHWIDS